MVATLDARIAETLQPFRAAVDLLLTMPGLKATAVAVIVAEIGDDMSQFPTAGHLRSWAGLCPRVDESAGKRRSTRTRQGASWLKTTLVQALLRRMLWRAGCSACLPIHRFGALHASC